MERKLTAATPEIEELSSVLMEIDKISEENEKKYISDHKKYELAKKYEATEETLKDFENLDELVNGGADIAFYKKKAQSIVDQLKKLKAEISALATSIKETDAEYSSTAWNTGTHSSY